MFDNVTLKIYDPPRNYIPGRDITDKYRSDINTYRGKIKNMGIYKNLNSLVICGSLAKYLYGENITPLTREEVRMSIEKLEQDINLDLKKAIVTSAEFGTSIIIKEKPFEYLNLFGNTKRLTRIEYSKWTGVETVTYTSKKGSFEFIGYDKVKEMLDRKQEIPSLFAGANVLRLEFKIRNRKGIKSIFKNDLTAQDLLMKIFIRDFKNYFMINTQL
ncbi:hypothetical protein K7I13_05260 [Brucepastera parasyntrophica]|uniref:phage/plasmid replication domain-containing protein n=1 Tax=Brucepastera parasyntrophica TaxID=2880008 RepID=UPI00210C63C6|nr:phage/plasmid replication protein [Brucepastera parasyntrophica]ULQ60682.1 hypothetical protein K7I13_05260 [Brucepastera parasyntrophica]